MLLRGVLPALLLVAAACTQAAPERSSLPDVATSSTTLGDSSVTDPPADGGSSTTTDAPTSVDAPGRLVIVGANGEVVVTTADRSDRQFLTVNGFRAAHLHPVWSPDGSRIAFAEGSGDGAFVVVLEGGREIQRLEVASLPFYLQWDDTGSRIGLLRNDPETVFALDVIPASDGGEVVTIDGGAPLYFDWSPGASDLSIHASNGAVRVSEVLAGPAELDVDVGPYAVPQWSSRGVVHVADLDDRLELRVAEPGGATTPLVAMPSATHFIVAPAGDRVAVYVPPVGEEPDPIDADALDVPLVERSAFVIVDLAGGELVEIARGETVAFFWSPDGSKMLFFDLDREVGPVWKVYDVASAETMLYPSLRLGEQFVERVLPFFEQYALSMQLWAPDSSAFAYPAQVPAGAAIFVQPLDGGVPQLVSDGTWVSWSPS